MNASIKEKFTHMSIEEKILLVEDLWDNISETYTASIPLSDRQKETLDKRFENYNKNPASAIPWHTLKSKLEQKHNL